MFLLAYLNSATLLCKRINFRDEITDIINNPEELLYLLFGEIYVRELCEMLYAHHQKNCLQQLV